MATQRKFAEDIFLGPPHGSPRTAQEGCAAPQK